MLVRSGLVLLMAVLVAVCLGQHVQAVSHLPLGRHIFQLSNLSARKVSLTIVPLFFHFVVVLVQVQIPHTGRSSNTLSSAATAGKLSRRWWFGWSGSLGKEPDDAEDVRIVPPEMIVSHPPPSEDALSRWLAELRRHHPEFIQVTLPGAPDDREIGN